jgi:hypothetical protein
VAMQDYMTISSLITSIPPFSNLIHPFKTYNKQQYVSVTSWQTMHITFSMIFMHCFLCVAYSTLLDNGDSIAFALCIQHTLNKTTNFVYLVKCFKALQMVSLLYIWVNQWSWTWPHDGHACTLVILSAFKTLHHLMHFLSWCNLSCILQVYAANLLM